MSEIAKGNSLSTKISAAYFIYNLMGNWDTIKSAHGVIVFAQSAESKFEAANTISRAIAGTAIKSLIFNLIEKPLSSNIWFNSYSIKNHADWLTPGAATGVGSSLASGIADAMTDKIMSGVDSFTDMAVDTLDGHFDWLFSGLESTWDYFGNSETFGDFCDAIFDGAEGLEDDFGLFTKIGQVFDGIGMVIDFQQMITDGGIEVFLEIGSESLYEQFDFVGSWWGDLFYDLIHPNEDLFSIPSIISDLFDQGYTTASPIVMDLDGDGIETINVKNSNVSFDMDDDGRSNRTGWLSGDDGFLVFDRNHDGIINNGNELFGNSTGRTDREYLDKLRDSRPMDMYCSDGFMALAQEDTNGDGVLNALDDNWLQLRVWRDVNQDGVSQANELFTMDDLGISAINVDFTSSNSKQNGNTLWGTGSYIDTEGDSHYLTDAWFEQDTFTSGYSDTIEVPEDMQGLPNMGGSGAVRDLLEAA